MRTSRGPGTGRWYGRSTWSVPLRVSCPGPLLRLACLRGGGPVPVPPYLAWGCGGGKRASPGGVPSTIARGVWGQALPLPRLPAHWAGYWGPLPTCCGRGRVGVGAQHCPLGLHALWRLRAAGVVGGCPPTWLGAVRPPWGGSKDASCASDDAHDDGGVLSDEDKSSVTNDKMSQKNEASRRAMKIPKKECTHPTNLKN